MMKMSDLYGKLNEPILGSFEEKWNITLLEPYRDFLLKFNGGHPNKDIFRHNDPHLGMIETRINYFYGIYDDKEREESVGDLNTLMHYWLQDPEPMPPDLFPIAGDEGGNLICIGIGDGSDKGKIYFWHHELPENKNIWLIANDFSEFIDSLYSEDRSNIEKSDKGWWKLLNRMRGYPNENG